MNINRDYLIINDVKKSNVKLDNGSMFFYITDKNTQNIFVNLVINISNNDLIQKYANIENAEDYTLTMNIVKPDNTYEIIEGKLHDKEKAIFEFDLPEDCVDKIGSYKCELLTKCNINDHEEITTSNELTYKVKSSVLNDLDDIVEAPEYPLVIQLFDKLSDIEQYEEDRRANELARQLAEEQRQAKHNELVAGMTNSIQTMDNKVVEVENRISAKEQAVDKLIVDTKADIDDYKVAKDTEIDEYKTAKDQQIDQAITNQNNKIDALEAKDIAHETSITNIEAKNVEQDNRLDVAENRLDNIGEDIQNTIQPTIDAQNSRLDSIEAVNVSQGTRLDAIEIKNQQQDDRLLNIEKVNKRQDIDINCLFNLHSVDIEEEGNSVYLQNSADGRVAIDNIQGNTMVNCNKEADKELILNGNINTEGYSNITLNKGVDGGLVDVALEGNTMVNVCDQKDPVAITKSYTVETGNHVALQGEYDGKCRPVVTGNTLWIDNDTEDVLTAFDESKNLRLQSSFEDKVVTQEMVDAGEELAENLGKYKVDYVISREDGTVGQTKTFYLNSPLLEGDTIEQQGNNVVHVHRYSEPGTATNIKHNAGIEANLTDCYAISVVHSNKFVTNSQTELVICNKLPHNVTNGDYSHIRSDGSIPFSTSTIIFVKRAEVDAYASLTEWFENSGINFVAKLASPQYEVISQNDTILCDSYVNGHLDVDSVVPIKKVDFLPFEKKLTYLYSSTQYAVQFVSDAVSKVDITLGGAKLLNQDVVVGTNKYMITTPRELVDNKLVVSGAGLNIEKVVVTEAIEQDFGYFEGMKSVGECEELEVKSGNKNLLDCTPLYDENNFIKKYNGYGFWTYKVKVEKGKTYTVSIGATERITIEGDTPYLCISTHEDFLKSSSNQWINHDTINFTKSVTIPSVDGYLYIQIANDINRIKMLLDNVGYIQIEEGSVATDYIPHQSNTQQLTHEPLRAVGDIKDKYVLIDGKWYIERNCGEVVFDGSKNYLLYKESDNYMSCCIPSPYSLKNEECICNNTINNSLAVYNCDGEGIWCNAVSGYTYLCLSKNKLVTKDIDGFKQYVSQNPYIIICILQTPTYEPINYNPFTAYSDVTHISNNSTIPCNMTIKNTGYNCLLKPNTTYTVSSNLGLNTVTTPSTLTEDCLRFYDTDTSDVTTMRDVMVLEGDYTTGKPLPSHFAGIESAFEQQYDETVGKYRVKIRIQNEDANKENYIEFYINEPLRGVRNVKDKVYVKDDKVVVERKCGQRAYQDGDFGTYLTDKVNTVYQLAEPTYEEVEYNDVKLFIESFKNSTLFYNSNIPVTSKLWYSYSVPLVDTVAQTASISDEQDNMIIDLVTQVAVMEMMLM